LSLVRLGISACLLGQEVRFDGGHKRDSFLVDELGEHVQWVPVCPEVEVGMGTPREALQLVRDGQRTRMLTLETGIDYTDRMREWAHRRLVALAHEDLDGYVLKKNSPSCGMLNVRLFNRNGDVSRDGQGLFAAALLENLPLLPVAEEAHLDDPPLRDNFFARVFAYRRLKDYVRGRWTIGALAALHIARHLQFQFRELVVPTRV
jgi:uncharacterized protein YbbK (DUF523 family)